MTLPVRVRLTAWYAVLLAVIIAVLGAFLVVRLRADLVAGLDRTLRPAADQIALGYHEEGVAEVADVSGTVLSGEAGASQVLTPAGRVLVSYGDPVARTPMIGAAETRRILGGGEGPRVTTLSRPPGRFRVVARSVTRGRVARVVVAAASMAPVDRSVHRLLVLLLLAGPAALAVITAGGWWMARRAMRPVGELTTEARQIGVERLADRLAVPRTGGDELAQLATTLNSMLARIQAGVEEQQRLFADASHELRGPLAAMRAEIDVSLLADDLDPAASAVLRSAREEVDRLGHTVDDLLTLARADQGALDLRLRALDLATVAAGTCDRLRALARERGITLEGDLQAAPVRGDGTRVGQAVANLVHNAITFSPAGTTVLVRTAIVDGEAILGVIDEGPGIPADQRERVFDRFSRLDASRTRATGGSGIGLSIVHEIARAHGGRAWNEPAPGRGSAFLLAFPLRGDDAAPEEPAGQATTSTASA